MADGHLLFDTKLEDSGLVKGLKGIGKLAKGTFNLYWKALKAGAVAAGGLAIAVGKVGSEFEAQMSRVQAISGATETQLKSLNDQALQLGADTAFSAKEAAAGMENLASAGFNVNEIMDAMPGLLDLAAISGGDVAGASEVAASAIRAFGLEAGTAGHVADVFAKTAADTNAEAQDMGEALKYVGPVAKAMGLSLEETAASIGIMSDAGIKGGMAGTALRGSLSRLAKPTKIMKDSMDELGLSFYDSQGKMLPLSGIIQELKDKTAGLTDEQKNNALVTLFGQESLSGMLALIDAGPDKLNALTGALVQSDGAAKDMAKTMMNNTKGAIEELKGSAETLGITIYQANAGPLKDLAKQGTEYINQLTDAFKNSGNGAKGMAETIGSILSDIVVKFASYAPKMIQSGTEIMNSFFDGIRSADVGTAVADTIVALALSFSQFTGQLFSTGIEIITQIVAGIAQSAPMLVQSGNEATNQFITSLTENLPTFLQSGLQIIMAIGQGLVENIPSLIPTVLSIITTFADFIIQNLPTVIDLGIQIVMALAQGLIDNLPWFIATLPRLINDFTNALIGELPKILMMGLKIIVELGKGLIQNLPLLIANIPAIIMAIINAFTLIDFINLGSKLITSIGSGIKSMATNLGITVKNLSNTILNTIKNLWAQGPQIGSTFINAIRGGISGVGNLMLNVVRGLGRAAINGLISIFAPAGSIGATFINNLRNGILTVGTSIQIALSSIGTNAVKAIKAAFSGASTIGMNLIRGIWNGISNMTGWILDRIGGFASSVISSIKSFFGIHSPSKIMEKEVGKWLPPGIAIGFDKSMPELNKDIDKQLDKLTDKMQAGVEARATITGAKIASGSNIYGPNPYDRTNTKDGSTAMITGDINTTVELDGRQVGYSTARYSSEEMALDEKRRLY